MMPELEKLGVPAGGAGEGGGGEQFKKDCKKVLIKLHEKLTEKSPLNCTVMQNATSFDPGQMIN